MIHISMTNVYCICLFIPKANSFGRIGIWKEEICFVPTADREKNRGGGVPGKYSQGRGLK